MNIVSEEKVRLNVDASFFVAKGQQAPLCSHKMVFAGRKNMEHDSAECALAKGAKSIVEYCRKICT